MSSSIESRLRRLAVAAVALVALAIVAPSGVASADAVVDDIVPADGSALADDPGQVVVRFSEPILADGITVELVSSTGVAEQPTAALDPADPAIIIVELPPLPDGTHQVRVTARDPRRPSRGDRPHQFRDRNRPAAGERPGDRSARGARIDGSMDLRRRSCCSLLCAHGPLGVAGRARRSPTSTPPHHDRSHDRCGRCSNRSPHRPGRGARRKL